VHQEEARDARGVRWIEDAVQDVRFGVRALVKTPAFSIVAVLSLVLGIGVNTAIFTILKAALNPGTINAPETFVYVPGRWSKPAYDHLRANSSAFSCPPSQTPKARRYDPPGNYGVESTHRTAGCGPACPVVWEGNGEDHSPSPIPIARDDYRAKLDEDWIRVEPKIAPRILAARVELWLELRAGSAAHA